MRKPDQTDILIVRGDGKGLGALDDVVGLELLLVGCNYIEIVTA